MVNYEVKCCKIPKKYDHSRSFKGFLGNSKKFLTKENKILS